MLALLAALAPFVLPEFLVANDVYKHVMVARVMAEFHNAALNYSSYYTVSWLPAPTLLGEAILAALVKLCDPVVAAKLYYVALAVGLWLSCRYYLTRLGLPAYAAVILLPLLHDTYMFAAFMPFLGSMAVYPLLLGVLIRWAPGWARSLALAAILVLLYGFHIVGAVIGAFTIFVYSVDTVRRRVSWPMLLSGVPTALLLFYYHQKNPGASSAPFFYPPSRWLQVYLANNAFTLSRLGGGLFLVLTAILVSVAVWQAYRRQLAHPRLLLLALVLVVAGMAMPFQMGAAVAVGPRTFPFAAMAVVGALSWNGNRLRVAAGLACAFLICSSVLNTPKALAIQPSYREFLSGMSTIPMGSKLLVIVEDLSLGGNKYILPFDSVEDLYNIYRGGTNPYVLAEPFVGTGGTPLRATYELTYSSKWSSVIPGYQGVSKDYDYIVCWGGLAETRQRIAREAPLVFTNGRLSIYSGARSTKP